MKKHETFALNLEAIRALRGLSIAEFAEEIGVPKSTLQSVRLSGHTTLDTAIRISEGLKLPLDSLVGDAHLTQKIDIVQHILQSVEWLQPLSSSEREDVIFHIQKILEVLCK